MKKVLSIFLSFAMILSITTVLSVPVSANAASTRSNAIKAYKKFLKNNETEYSQFSLIYLDNNSVPELLAKRSDFVSIFTYYGGGVKDTYFVSNIGYSSNYMFNYFKKTGVIRRGSVSNGYSAVGYPKLSKGKMKRTVYAQYDMGTGANKGYFKVKSNDKTVKISKSKYKSWIKKNTKGKKASHAKFFSNTASGRKNHCK